MNSQNSSETSFKSPYQKPSEPSSITCIRKWFKISTVIFLIVTILIVLFYISLGLYGQTKSQEADNFYPPQAYLSNDSLPQFYIVIPENMPDSELNPAPAVTGKTAYRDENDLSIYLLTYNAARQSPSEDLTDLFDFQRVGAHDIYVVAMEELTFWSMVTWDPYLNQFDNIFGERGYVRLERVRFMITSLSIYVPKYKLSKFHNVTTDTITTDLGRRKGGIGIRLYYNNISLAFVGAHLAAHEEHYQTRLKNYREIIEGVHFSHRPKDGILDQDYAFFIGDLNFRINNLTSQQVYDAILFAEKKKKDENRWIPLLQYDQLHLAQKLMEAFHHFKEANITFPPTYRFIISTDNYDWEKRKPAFTDRILYRNTLSDRVAKVDQERVAIRVFHYESIRQYCGSDHKPVRAIAHISASAFVEKNKWLQSRVKRRLSKRDSPNLRAKTHRAPAVQSRAQEEGSSSDSVVADSSGSRNVPRSRYNYHEDPSLSLARHMTVQFEAIRDWTVERNHTIYFRVVDNRTNQTVGADYPGLFKVLSNWDWIGLYKEDFYSLDNYVTFAYPQFGESIEEAEDALALLNDESEDHLQPRTSSQASSTTTTTNRSTNEHEFSAMFDDQSFLFSTGRYVLIYRRKNGDVMGISEPFEIRSEVDVEENQIIT